MPSPLSSTSPVHCPIEATPNGVTRTVATTIARASPSSWEKAAPVRDERTMYAAQQAPAAAASPRPMRSRSANGVLSAWEMSSTPIPAPTTATTSFPRRDSAAVRVSGPMNSIVTATPIGSRPREA